MRVDWQQRLAGCTLLEIRNILRGLAYTDTPFTVEFLARRLEKTEEPSLAALEQAQRLADGLIVNGLAVINEDMRFVLTDTGLSLRAATATKRFKRARADKAIAKMLGVAAEVNADPIFLYDVAWIAVYGSYITDEPDLGDIDLAIEFKGRWKGTDANRETRLKAFVVEFPPPDHVEQSFIERLCWPETCIRRMLKVDRAIKLIDRSELEALGCPHRRIYPDVADIPAKDDWTFARNEILLNPE